MKKATRPGPRYASRYESLRPFLRFLAWGCWHKTEYEKISGKSARSYDDGLARARVFLPEDTLREKRYGHKSYITLRGDAYYGCSNFLVNSYRMKSLPLHETFYTVVLLQILGMPGSRLNFRGIVGHPAWDGVFPASFEEKHARRQQAANEEKRKNRRDVFDDDPDDDSAFINDSHIHDVLRHLREAGYVEMLRRGGDVTYRLRENPLEGLTKPELDALLAAIGFYKNVTAVSVIGYQLEAVLQSLYRLESLPAVPAQFRGIAFDRVLDDEILHAAFEALRKKKALRFRYKGKVRIVFPLRVVTDFASGGRQYLEAREKDSPVVSSYRLDRITDIRLVSSKPPAGAPELPPPVRFVVRFRIADGDRAALRARILERSPRISLLSEEEDALICAVDDPEPLRFFPWLRGFLPRAEVLAGADGLRERMRNNIKEALRNYGCPVQ